MQKSINLIQRVAVSTLFFINGFLYANWASRLPELEQQLNISHAQLGSLLFTLALGAVSAMPFTGWFAMKFGSANVIKLMAVLICFSIVFLAVPDALIAVSLVFFMIGVSNGAMDVVMNEQAVLVERNWKKTIMSSFHAVWSIGMAVGAVAASLFSKAEIPLQSHLMIVCSFALMIFLFATRYLIKERVKSDGQSSSFMLPTKAIIPLGLIAFCGMLSEGAMADWSAIYMNQVIGATEALSALVVGAFGVAMTIGRVFGDYLTEKLGKKKLMVMNAIVAILGFTLALGVATSLTTVVGFFMVGLGLATIVPIIYSTAGNTPGISPSLGIAMATTIGYSGFFVGPPVIGYLGDVFGLRRGLSFALVLLIIMLGIIATQNFQVRKSVD
ncbi:MAG: MFS transporter [Cyclobacteriaceae bacterium]